MYYIRYGLGRRWEWLAAVFSVCCLLAAAFGIGSWTQVNAIAAAVDSAVAAFRGSGGGGTVWLLGRPLSRSALAVSLLTAAAAALVLLGGVKRVGAVTAALVPVMAGAYILAALAVVFRCAAELPAVLGLILRGAFQPRAAVGAAGGLTLAKTLRLGVGRGLFSNEAGLGSAPIAHAAAAERDPVRQGLCGVFEVFADTGVLCTLTALALLCGLRAAGAAPDWGAAGADGAALLTAAFAPVFGSRGAALLLSGGLALFALSSILSWSLYGERCFAYLFGPKATGLYRVGFVLLLAACPFLPGGRIWDLADALNALMALPNLIALFALAGPVADLTRARFGRKPQKNAP